MLMTHKKNKIKGCNTDRNKFVRYSSDDAKDVQILQEYNCRIWKGQKHKSYSSLK